MLRRLVATGLILGIQGLAWSGLGMHAHLDAHSDAHHEGRVVHAHTSPHIQAHLPQNGHPSDSVDVHAPDDGAPLLLNPFVAVKAPSASFAPVLAGAVYILPATDRLAAKPPVSAEGGHDPPARSALPPRAPPLA